MNVVIPNFNDNSSIDLAALTPEHLVIAYVDGKPIGFMCCYEGSFWFQTCMEQPPYVDQFDSIYEAIKDFKQDYPKATFEAYE
jgi:hypothetical protein